MSTGRRRGRIRVVLVVAVLVVAGCRGTTEDVSTPTTSPGTGTSGPATTDASGTTSASPTPGAATSSSPTVTPGSSRSASESTTTATTAGWLGGTPPAAVAAHFETSGLAHLQFQCAATLSGAGAATGPTFILVPVDLVESWRVGRVLAADLDLDISPFDVGGLGGEAPDRLPEASAVDRSVSRFDELADDLEVLEVDEVPVAEQPLGVPGGLVSIPDDLLDDLLAVSDPAATLPPDDRGVVAGDGEVRVLDDFDGRDWHDLWVDVPVREVAEPIPVPLPPVPELLDVWSLQPALLCGDGWSAGTVVSVRVVDADGVTQVDTEVTVGDDGELRARWLVDPAVALGAATVTASDGVTTVSDTVTVTPSPSPVVRVLGETERAAGEPIRVGVSGLDPLVDVVVHAYAASADTQAFGWDWVGMLPTVSADDAGQAVLEVPTSADDPAGRYCLLLPGPPPVLVSHCSDAGFDLVAP